MNGNSKNGIENDISRPRKEISSSQKEMAGKLPSKAAEREAGVFEKSPGGRPVRNILVVDDEKLVQEILKAGLEKFGYQVEVAGNGNEGLDRFRKNPADLIITDIFMPEHDGHTFIHQILQEFPETKIFAITGHRSFEPEPYIDLDIAKALGAVKVFAKPIKLSEIISIIKGLSV